jgi:succinate dehydrogenase/fumarate reductase flavoprotein subunit
VQLTGGDQGQRPVRNTVDHQPTRAADALPAVSVEGDRVVAGQGEPPGNRTVDSFHKELGSILWDHCGMERTKDGLAKALQMVRELVSTTGMLRNLCATRASCNGSATR